MQKPIISIKNLNKSFGKHEVLKDINVTFYKGDTVGIVGANGAGKTTLIEIICQSQKPSSGEVAYHIGSGKENVKKYFGVQFQEGSWPEGLSAFDLIKFYRGIYPAITFDRTKKLVEIFELEDFISTPLNKLSGGQKQRFNAMLAVLHNPEIIFFDEVTTGLDIQLQYKILNYIKSLTEHHKKTTLLVSHGPEELEALSDRVILISQGGILIDMATEDIISKFGSVRKMMDLYFENKLQMEHSYESSKYFKSK